MKDLRALIRRRRATRPTLRRVPVQAHPDNIAREYERAMIGLMIEIHRDVLKAIGNGGFKEDADSMIDVRYDAGENATIGAKIGDIKVDTFRTLTRARAGLLAQGIGQKVQRFADNAVGAQIKAVIQVNPLATAPGLSPELLNGFVAENVALIRTVPERYFKEVEQIVSDSVSMGRRAAQVSALVTERFEVSKSNAKRIARDQVAKMNGAVTQARHKQLGINAYIWRTSNDERVRDTHEANEGERFEWDNPPAETGHPGDDIQCRCRAEPDLSALLGS